ncbi:F-box only protein 3-like [Ciona intestinalis]
MSLEKLPEHILIQILKLLSHTDVIHVGETCKTLYAASKLEPVWATQCKRIWLVNKVPEKFKNWIETFKYFYQEFGDTIECYATIRKVWNELEGYLKENCPGIFSSLLPGVEKKVFEEFENLGYHLPKDFKLFYRIHNGQNNNGSGLLGSFDSEITGFGDVPGRHLLPFEHVIKNCDSTNKLSHLTLFEACEMAQTYFSIMMELSKENESEPNIFAVSYLTMPPITYNLANTFTEWIQNYTEKLTAGDFPIIEGQILMFDVNTETSYTSYGITVSVRWLFHLQLSHNKTHYSYYIKMSMAEDAPVSNSCQLLTRHWEIMDKDGKTETVNGPGVVGQYPVMRPGAVYEWQSATSFNTTTGSMKGHFVMALLSDPTRQNTINVICPEFNMKPYFPTQCGSMGRE